MKQRKHRFYIDVTYSSALPMRKAAKGLQLVLNRIDIAKQPVWAYDRSPYVDKLSVVEVKDQ